MTPSPWRRSVATSWKLRGTPALVALVLATSAIGGQGRPSSDTVSLRIIVVESAEDARLVQTRLARGEDFASLARALSVDPSADNGGQLGTLARSGLRPELRGAIEGVKEGQVAPAVRIPTGFAILKVEAGRSVRAGAAANPGLAAQGAVKYVLDVGGFGASLASVRQFSDPAVWELSPGAACDARTRAVTAAQQALEQDFPPDAPARTGAVPSDAVHGPFVLGQLHAYYGRMDQAIAQFQRARDAALATDPALVPDLEEALGIAYLHRSELANGVYHEPGDRCLLSPAGLRPFTRTEDSERAIQHFSRYLDVRPHELEVRWLLNLAYMTTGGYPGSVPPAQLVPAAALAAGEDVGRFVDVAARSGLRSFGSAGGVIVDDFDNDGHLDVVTSSLDTCASLAFFRGNGDGTFTDRTGQSGLGGQTGGLNILQADYDNDGDLDILVLRGGWELPQRKSLLRNDGTGTFTDVTEAAGLARPATSTQAAVWTDVDNDGFLDLFVGNENAPAQLFRNWRDGTFRDVARASGVGRPAFTKGVAAGDYDNDGWTDLYVSNSGGGNFLYRNNGNGTFDERAKTAGVPGPGLGFATWFFDYDNDGWQDLFVTSYYTSVEETVRTYLRQPNGVSSLKLYRNAGDGTFLDVSVAVGLDRVFMPMGANFGDIDNDGFLDIYLGTGNPSYGALVPSVLLRNREGRTFADVTASSGTGELHKGHGVAFADLDGDGDEEIVFEVGGATPGDAHALRLFQNPGHGRDWLDVTLTGTTSNRRAVGARVTVTVSGANGKTRRLHRTVGSGGSFGASPLRQHIGLGAQARPVDIEVWWPASGTRQRFRGVAANQAVAIREGATGYSKATRPASRLRREQEQDDANAR